MCVCFFCAVRQVVRAAAGCVGPPRGDWCDSSQQPTERCAHLGLAVLDLPMAGPARNTGCFDLHTNSRYYGARQVKLCEPTCVILIRNIKENCRASRASEPHL